VLKRANAAGALPRHGFVASNFHLTQPRGESPRKERNMFRLSRYAALAFVTAVTMSSSAYARSHHHSIAGAHNGMSDMDIRQQCYAEAKQRWSSTNQDMQTNRDFAYRTCAFDHGVHNP
jgi:hypothetical protein